MRKAHSNTKADYIHGKKSGIIIVWISLTSMPH
jgi:hypothetical protein